MNPLRTRSRFPTTVETGRLEKLRALSKATHVPMSRLMDEALDALFYVNERKDNDHTDRQQRT